MERFPALIGEFMLLGDLGDEPVRERIMKCLDKHGLGLNGLAAELLNRQLEIPVIEYGYHDSGQIRVIMRAESLNRVKSVWLDFESEIGGEIQNFDSLPLNHVMRSGSAASALMKDVINTVTEYDQHNLFSGRVTEELVGQYW